MDVLFVNACVRDGSRTRRLADAVLEKLGGTVREVDLGVDAPAPMDCRALEFRSACVERGGFEDGMFRFAKELASADALVIAAPFWDLSFPACLRAWIEHVMVQGITFSYTPRGIPMSLCRLKRLVYVSTAGGPVIGSNLGFDYVRQLAGAYWGVGDARLFQAQNLDIDGADVEAVMTRALDEIRGWNPND